MANDNGETDRSLPWRTLAAATALGGGGWALAWVVTILLANVSAPSVGRMVHPARFSYGVPTSWTGSTALAWIVIAASVLLFPVLFNRSWASRRLLSAAGVVKLAATILLLFVVAYAALIGSDVFTGRPWGGGTRLPFVAHLILVGVAGLCGGVLFALFGEGMAGGAPDRLIATHPPPHDMWRAFARGFLAAAVIALLAFVAVDALNLLVRGLYGFLGESAEVSPLGWSRLNLGLALGLGLLLASCGALLVATAPGSADRRRRAASLTIAAVPAVTLVALALWFENFARTRGEMGTTFARAASLGSAPKPRLMILPSALSNDAWLYPYAMEISMPGYGDEVVGVTNRNIELAQQYLRRLGGRWTAHTIAAWQLASAGYDRLLEPEAALRARLAEAEATGSLFATMALVAKIPNMPPSDATRDVTARLLDSTYFSKNATAGARLQGEARVPHDRALTGVVELPAGLRKGARVALYRQGNAKAPSSVPSAIQLVAAATPDEKGRFTFDSLAPAFYSVGVLLPESLGSDPARVSVNGALGVADVTGDRRRVDAGTIRVSSR